MLTSKAATDVERPERESSSEEDEIDLWKVEIPLVHPTYVMFVLRLSLPRKMFSDLSR